MKTHDPDRPLIFIHVPKCGGRSVRDVVDGWFGDGLFLHYFNGAMPERHDIDALHSRAHPVCVYGHFNRARGFGVEDSYPQAEQFVTILRDPFEQLISQYYWKRRPGATDPTARTLSLQDYLMSEPSPMLLHFPRPVTDDNYRDIVDEFFVQIGFTEDLVPSLTRIAAALDQEFDPATLEHRNASARDAQNDAVQHLRATFCGRNPLEFAVYDYAKARFAPSQGPGAV